MKIEYTKVRDYYLPNIVAPQNLKNFELGKYGNLRLKYLKENKRAEYTILLMDNKLQEHLLSVNMEANKRFEILMKQLAKKENITEELKAINQLEWVRKIKSVVEALPITNDLCKANNIKNCAEEIILNELIYV